MTMPNQSPVDEEKVFEKLEKEAFRHSTRSGVKRKPPERKTGESLEEKAHRRVPRSDSVEEWKEKSQAGRTVNTSTQILDNTEGQTLRENKQEDLSEQIRRSLQKELNGETSVVPRARTKTHGRDEHPSHQRKHFRSLERRRTKMPAWARMIALLLTLLLVVCAAGTGLVVTKLNKIPRTDGLVAATDAEDAFDTENAYGVKTYSSKLITSDDVTNILLIGQDRRKGDAARMRSDAMIVCSINRKTREIILTSLMRDMYLPVPGKGYGMINATYLAGGFELLNKTIEKNFGIRIDGNVEVDFERFVGLMTLVGSIDLDLSTEEAKHLQASGYDVREGFNTLDSEQVLAYCRMRKNVGGDWSRTDRQRKVISTIYRKLRSEDLGTVYRFIDEALPLFRTDLSNRKILQLAYSMVTNRMRIRHSYRLPEEGTYTQEIREETLHVLIPDIRANCRLIQKYIYGYLSD